ncbi:MAG: 30S ribosomal protein S12 methylthiotransferase RimO [Candidatus Dadabacteria bacterium]|nr:MAG: 30S ribosomal protein S12 methylthiotransferase RimO [Candidatus Dadabacteria bacterium]
MGATRGKTLKGKLNIIDDHTSKVPALNVVSAEENHTSQEFFGRAAVITLGCAKNQVDSEVMLGVLRNNGFDIVSEVEEADLAVINTCGFLESAVTESIDCILEVGELKKEGRLRKLIVAGCAVERYREELQKALPEVDEFITTNDLMQIGDVATDKIQNLLKEAGRPYFLYDDKTPRQLSGVNYSAYVKIAEGCNRPCTFCIIPKIRGAMRSRSIESVVQEVNMLAEQGVKEVNLLAQDLTSYGRDRKGESLSMLLEQLDARGGVNWIRLLYAYPIGIDQQLLEIISSAKHICEYLDLPLQHVSEQLLKNMKRPLGRYAPRAITEYIRTIAPAIHLRTTFIVGFPGESETDIDELEKFVLEGHFGSVGVFTYSAEEGTPAALMPGQIPEQEKQQRRERIMLAQQKVNEKRLAEMLGTDIEVLIEGVHPETDLLLSGRSRFQAPEVDGTIIINDLAEEIENVSAGTIGTVEITDLAGYDLIGTLKYTDN